MSERAKLVRPRDAAKVLGISYSVVVIALVLGLGGRFCKAQEITVAAAADLQFVMQDVTDRFQKETGKSVKLIYGSSGNFFQQIQNGAPFDMFFSANLDYPKKLENAGLTEAGTFYQYAVGRIVIWVPNDSKLDVSSGLRSLLHPSIKKIAIANPQHAPYGQAAVAAMKKENIYDKVADKLVLGENISQTTSFVVSGSADVGIVALSLAMSPSMKDKGRYAEIPSGEYPPIEQACVILKSSKQKDTAKTFLNFIKTPVVADLFRTYGFALPSASGHAQRGKRSIPAYVSTQQTEAVSARWTCPRRNAQQSSGANTCSAGASVPQYATTSTTLRPGLSTC